MYPAVPFWGAGNRFWTPAWRWSAAQGGSSEGTVSGSSWHINGLRATIRFSRPSGRVPTARFFWPFAFGARSLWGLSGFLFYM